jgi:hypothetical protein
MTAGFTKLTGYHDAELIGVTIDRHRQTAELRFTWTDQSGVTLALRGVRDFRVTDLISQNVVSRLMLHDATAFSATHIRAAIGWARNFFETQPGFDHVDGVIEKIRDGALALLILEPSWGAELVASFNRIDEQRS